MENTYYLKLVSGEDIVARVEDYQDDLSKILLEDPMLVQYFRMKDDEYGALLRPWVPSLGSSGFNISISKSYVMFISDLSEKLSDFYNEMIQRARGNVLKADIEEHDEPDWDEEMVANSIGPKSDTIH